MNKSASHAPPPRIKLGTTWGELCNKSLFPQFKATNTSIAVVDSYSFRFFGVARSGVSPGLRRRNIRAVRRGRRAKITGRLSGVKPAANRDDAPN